MWENAAWERSMILPPKGPRSLITTVTPAPVPRLVTVTTVPRGSQGLAAVRFELTAYQEACPVIEERAVPTRRWPRTPGARTIQERSPRPAGDPSTLRTR